MKGEKVRKNTRKQPKTAQNAERTGERTPAERESESKIDPQESSGPARPGPVVAEREQHSELERKMEGTPPSDTDPVVEKPNVLADRLIDFMKVMRRAGYSIQKIADTLKLSKSTVHSHVWNIAPVAEAAVSDNDNAASPDGQLPRIASEVSARRPILEPISREEIEDRRQYPEPNGTAETQILDDNNPRWKMAKALLVADAIRYKVNDPVEYVSDYVLPDIALSRDWASWLPGSTREQKTRNFRKSMMYASRYLEFKEKIMTDGKMAEEAEDRISVDA